MLPFNTKIKIFFVWKSLPMKRSTNKNLVARVFPINPISDCSVKIKDKMKGRSIPKKQPLKHKQKQNHLNVRKYTCKNGKTKLVHIIPRSFFRRPQHYFSYIFGIPDFALQSVLLRAVAHNQSFSVKKFKRVCKNPKWMSAGECIFSKDVQCRPFLEDFSNVFRKVILQCTPKLFLSQV